MSAVIGFARYIWRFFIGDVYQLGALAVAFGIVWLARALGTWDGLLAFALVVAVIWSDVWTRAARQARPQAAPAASVAPPSAAG